MNWRPYDACCHRSALTPASAFCGECRRPLLRCMAFQECMSLVSPTGPCPICLSPGLWLEKGAITHAKIGERLSIPLVFRNGSAVQRPVSVEAMTAFLGDAEVPVTLAWQHVEGQSERAFTVDTPPFAHAGLAAVRLVSTLATRYKGREERYAYAASLNVMVDAHDPDLNLAGAQFGHSALIHIATPLRSGERKAAPQREPLPLERAERYETRMGIRGYAGGLRIPRTLAFTFVGFPPDDRPADGATLGYGGTFSCGRAGRRYHAQANPLPSDLSLRPYTREGELDAAAAVVISRHHFDFLVLDDRLCLQVRGGNGVQVNAQKLGPGERTVLHDGDRIFPMPGHPDRLSLSVKFKPSLDSIETVEIARMPAVALREAARA